jgi:hypothetical protein
MTKFEMMDNLLKRHGGILKTAYVVAEGISKTYFLDYVCCCNLIRAARQYSMTVKTGYNPSNMTKAGIKVYTVKKELHELGATKIATQFGHHVKTYNLERTVCDIIASTSASLRPRTLFRKLNFWLYQLSKKQKKILPQ